MRLERVEFKDEQGRKYLVEVPDGFADMAEAGIVFGPPDLSELELPLEMEVKLNNQLYDRKLFTLADVRRRPEEIRAALMAILRIDVRRIKSLYGR